jgi:hypothetical protein
MGGCFVVRNFRATLAVYLAVCEQLDAAYGYPNAATKTKRVLPLASDLPADDQGRVYLAIPAEYCECELPSRMLPQLISSGSIEEITAADYRSAVGPPSPVS